MSVVGIVRLDQERADGRYGSHDKAVLHCYKADGMDYSAS